MMDELLTEAVEAHGGLSRWREISSLEGRIAVSVAGSTPAAPKVELALMASTHLPLICLEDVRPGGLLCTFGDDEMRLYRKSGELLQWRNRDDLQVGRSRGGALEVEDIFRSSAALWAALNAPFLFTWPGFVTREISASIGDCGPVRRLLVGFPPGLGGDMQVAIVSFDSDGLMRSMRYAAESHGLTPILTATEHAQHDGIVVGKRQFIQSKLSRPDGGVDSLALSLDVKQLRFR